jgi:RNA polymerase sigma factor (sigma-70 family)
MASVDPAEQPAEALLGLYPALLAFFRHRWRGSGAISPEDLAQDTIYAAWLALKRRGADEVLDLRGYVLGIARNKLADALTSASHRREEPLEPDQIDGMLAKLRVLAAEEQLLEAERRELLSEEIAQLPAADRRLLKLWCQQQLPHEELCRQLGLTAEECSRKKWRVMEALRERVARRLRSKRGQ